MFYGFIGRTGYLAIAPAATNELEVDEAGSIRYYSTYNPDSSSKNTILLVLTSDNPAKPGCVMQRLVDADNGGRAPSEARTAKSLLAVWDVLSAEGVELALFAREDS